MQACPLQQENRVGIVIATDKIAVAALHDIFPGPFKNQRHRITAHLLPGVELAAAFAATAVVEVRQVKLLHVVLAHQPQ
ncbi:hypothetical protein D3C76_1558070 [compost metagenome]